MKKVTILLAILALALMTVPAFALNNIVLNGDFQASPNHLLYWTDSIPGHNAFTTSSTAGDYFARSSSTYTESSMYQIVDASTSTGWIAGGIAETINFSFQYRRPDTAIAEYGIFYSSAASAPAFGGLDAPGAGWTLLQEVNTEPGLPQTATAGSPWGTITYSHTFDDSQPRWFVVAFEGQSHRPYSTTYYADFNNVSLTAQCTPAVPVPPSVLLLGSGLLGLVGVRFRKSC